jgi:hypothetical protein
MPTKKTSLKKNTSKKNTSSKKTNKKKTVKIVAATNDNNISDNTLIVETAPSIYTLSTIPQAATENTESISTTAAAVTENNNTEQAAPENNIIDNNQNNQAKETTSCSSNCACNEDLKKEAASYSDLNMSYGGQKDNTYLYILVCLGIVIISLLFVI